MKIGIRLEDKSKSERRVPFIPSDLKELQQQGFDLVVQSSFQRAFTDVEYRTCGIAVAPDLSKCDIIFGIKEISKDAFEPDKIYIFFPHVIKGQPHNMPMLRRMTELGNTLIDYERIADDKKHRLIFFGRHAGLAGMINTLWALGRRLDSEGISTPFKRLAQAMTYHDLDQARAVLTEIAENIRTDGIPNMIHPLVVGFAGYGNVSKGAQEIFDLLPFKEIKPEELADISAISNKILYKVIFKKEHCVKPKDSNQPFDEDAYSRYGTEKYESNFEQYVQYLTVLVNGIYWDSRYPRLLSIEKCRELWAAGKSPKLKVIGDISCDIDGAIQCTIKANDSEHPLYVYHPDTGEMSYGVEGHGPVIMAIDILPSEIPRESSEYFSGVLKQFVPALVNADYSGSFEQLNLPPELKRAVILYKGKLTPDYEYIQTFLFKSH